MDGPDMEHADDSTGGGGWVIPASEWRAFVASIKNGSVRATVDRWDVERDGWVDLHVVGWRTMWFTVETKVVWEFVFGCDEGMSVAGKRNANSRSCWERWKCPWCGWGCAAPTLEYLKGCTPVALIDCPGCGLQAWLRMPEYEPVEVDPPDCGVILVW